MRLLTVALVFFAAPGGILAQEVEQTEPAVLAPGDTVAGRFTGAGDQHEVVVTCERSTVCTLAVEVPVGTTVTISADEVIPRSGYTHRQRDPIRFRRYRFPAGRTLLRLRLYAGDQALDYRLTLNPVSAEEGDEVEPNDDAEHALALGLGRPVNGLVSRPYSDVDFYALEVPQRAIHHLSLRRTPAATSPKSGWIRVSDGQGDLYLYRFDSRFGEHAFYPVLDPGRYIVNVGLDLTRGGDRYTLLVEEFEPAVRGELLEQASAAIDRAVAWLAKTTPAQDEKAGANYPVAVTALALAALSEQGGYAARRDLLEQEYVDFLAARFVEDESGQWRGEKVSSPSTTIYEVAVATLGLAEAADAGSEKAAALARRGARYLLAAQQGREKDAAWGGPTEPSQKAHGGWRYTAPALDADLSVSGWCWVALSAVDAAGLQEPGVREALDAGLGFVRRCGDTDGFHYAPGELISATLNSIGALVYLLHGEEDWRLEGAFRTLDPHLPAGTQVRADNGYCFYHWYYGTRANYLRGGYPWQAWRSVMIRQLLLQQQADGRWKAIDYEDSAGDRFTTALGVMILRICLEQVPGYLKHEVRGF